MCLSQSRKQGSPRTTCGEASVSQVSTFLSFQSFFVLVLFVPFVCSYSLLVRTVMKVLPTHYSCRAWVGCCCCFVVLFIISLIVAVCNMFFALM